MATKRLEDITIIAAAVDTDIFHLQNSGGNDKVITKLNLLPEIKDRDVVTTSVDTDIFHLQNAANENKQITRANLLKDLFFDNPNNQVGTAYTTEIGDENKTVWMNNAVKPTISDSAREYCAINSSRNPSIPGRFSCINCLMAPVSSSSSE